VLHHDPLGFKLTLKQRKQWLTHPLVLEKPRTEAHRCRFIWNRIFKDIAQKMMKTGWGGARLSLTNCSSVACGDSGLSPLLFFGALLAYPGGRFFRVFENRDVCRDKNLR